MISLPINIIVVNLGPAGFEHVPIMGNPTTPSGVTYCTPYIHETDYLGETVPGQADLRVCTEVGTHTFAVTFTHPQTGGTTVVTDPGTCECPDEDLDGWCDDEDNCPTVPTPWFVPAGDSDCDGFSTAEEGFVGTDPADDCPDDPADDAWPADWDMNKWVNILDIVQWTPPVFNTKPPDPAYSIRKDFNGDNWINILDIVRLTPPIFNEKCT